MWTWVFLVLDLLGIWLLVNPGGLVALWTAGRATVSDPDRYVGRFVGTIILWTQALRLVAYVKGRTLHSALVWVLFLILTWVSALFAYKIVRYLASKKSNGGSLLDKSQWRHPATETQEQTRIRYATAWKKYRRLRRAFPLAFFGWLPVAYLLFSLFNFLHWNRDVAMVLVLAWIPFIPIAAWKWSHWRCPRCGYTFKGKYSSFFPERCHHCGLAKWAGPPEG